MTVERFVEITSLATLSETAKVCHLAFYHLKTKKQEEFTAADGAQWLHDLNFSKPNKTRLDDRLRESRETIRGQRADGFRLHANYVRSLENKYPDVGEKTQEVVEHGTILPEVDYKNTRGYIESLAKQINASYEQNIADGCAVLMRRLVEILIILSYRHLGIESAIQDGNSNYFMLERIIGDAKTNPKLALSRNTKEHLDTFRTLGNFSAHKIEYTCRREYIAPHIQDYRALVVELLHKAGIRV